MSCQNQEKAPHGQVASTGYIKSLIRHDLVTRMQQELGNILKNCPQNERAEYTEENQRFLKLYAEFVATCEKPIIWDEIEPFPRDALLDYNNFLKPTRPMIQQFLEKLVVIKLNGGLGTRMKCSGPKSLITVRNGLNFLDLTVQQIENLNAEYTTNVPLVLMNSFNTNDEREKMIAKYQDLKIKIYTFQQNRYPRIYLENHNLLCSSHTDKDKFMWYPPGHGDFYESFVKSGLLDKFREAGKEYCFISNIDNLGATVDFRMLDLMVTGKQNKLPEFLMEVTNKTAADIKGGTLIQYMGKLKLLEYEEVPRDHVEEFKSARKFSLFNTNNLYINLDAIKKIVSGKSLSLDVIANAKKIMVDGRKTHVIQLETSAGGGIGIFENAQAIMVVRSRFLSVETVSDLLLIRSNIYENKNGHLVMNPLRHITDVPTINLDEETFGDYKDIEKGLKKCQTVCSCIILLSVEMYILAKMSS